MPRTGDKKSIGQGRTLCSVDQNKANAALRELGAQLLQARKRAGLNQRELAKAAGFPAHSKISDIENGHRLVSIEEYESLLDALGITGLDERERIFGLAAQAAEEPGRLSVGPAVINETLVELIDHERAARSITAAGPLLLPGLLQTTDYARRIYGDSSEAGPRVALRAGRRDILTRRNPVQLNALLDSEALLRPVLPPAELVHQLQHILDLAARSNVTVQIVQSTVTDYHPMLSGQFELIEFPTASPIVLLDHYHASVFLRDPSDVAVYVEAAEYLCNEVAMSPEASLRLIAEIVNGMEST
jgi:transcriptional regulator with XRE-family HTH domain